MEAPRNNSLAMFAPDGKPEQDSNVPENRESDEQYLSGWALTNVITALMLGAFMLALDNTVLCMYTSLRGSNY